MKLGGSTKLNLLNTMVESLFIKFLMKSLDFDRQNLAEVIPIRPRLNAIKEEHADPEIHHLPKEVRSSTHQKQIYF